MTLDELGWSPFFAEHFKSHRDKGLVPGRVLLAHKSELQVFCEKGSYIAKISGKIRHNAGTKEDLPVTGDWVALRLLPDGSALIEALLPRKITVSRLTTGFRKKLAGQNEVQVLGANIDVIFIVTGLDRDYNLRRLERYLTLVYNSGATPVIILNKKDLCDDYEEKILEIESIAIGVPVHAITARGDDDLQELLPYFKKGHTVSLLGSSGVGKSTIINKLLGFERQKTNPISEAVNKGQHTTSNRELIFMPEGGIIVDNPGMREIDLLADDEDMAGAFQDIDDLAQYCRFSDCRHDSEPGCAVKQAVDNGELDAERLRNFKKMQQNNGRDNRRSGASRAEEQEKWYRKARR